MNESNETKRKRNNAAVKKSREKSKSQTQQTIQKINELKEENSQIEEKIRKLEEENRNLKSFFLDKTGETEILEKMDLFDDDDSLQEIDE